MEYTSITLPLEGANAEDVLRSCARQSEGKAVFTTSFGAEDQIITDIIRRLQLNISIETLDTGRLFPETYELWAETEKRYGGRIRAWYPDTQELEELMQSRGVGSFRESTEARHACCRVRKLAPLERLLAGRDCWITGQRKQQSVTRRELSLVEPDEVHGILKVSPLADWSEQDVWNYIRAYDVPYNPLHDRGYPSIGCACCTRAVRKTESIRAGRWWWEQPEQRECGLHHRPRH